MGSTIDTCKCPYCGNQEAYNEFWYKTGEEYVFCSECGYTYELFRDESREGDDSFRNMHVVEVKKPLGVISISIKDAVSTQMSPIANRKQLAAWRRKIREYKPEENGGRELELVVISSFRNGKINKEYLVGVPDLGNLMEDTT